MLLTAPLAEFFVAKPDRGFGTRRVPRRDEVDPSTACDRANATPNAMVADQRATFAAKLAASLAFALVGCATPVLKPSVDVPPRFAAAATPA
jgi:hypothetical protein